MRKMTEVILSFAFCVFGCKVKAGVKSELSSLFHTSAVRQLCQNMSMLEWHI